MNHIVVDTATGAVIGGSRGGDYIQPPSGARVVETEDWPEIGAILTDDGGFEAPPPPSPPPQWMPDISDRQFGEGLWHDGIIAFDDYIAFVGPGTIPPPLMAIIDELPDDETGGPTPRKMALGTVTGATTYRFDDPLVETVRRFFEDSNPIWTPEYLRQRWAVWATL